MVGPFDVLQDVVKRFECAGIDYFLVGSLASMYYGRPRFTNDIDLVVEIKATQLSQFEQSFPAEEFYCPPTEILRDEVARRGSFNLIHQMSGIKVDMILRKSSDFSISEFGRRRRVRFSPKFEAFIATPEDVIIQKLEFYREGASEKHLNDIREILMGTKVDQSFIDDWVNRLGLKAQWEKI